MFTKTAQFYDAIYSWKDYETESAKLHDLIQQHKHNNGSSCWTSHVARVDIFRT